LNFVTAAPRRLILVLAVLFGLAAAVASIVPIDRIELGTRPRRGANAAEILRAYRVHTAAHIVLFGALAAAAWFAAKAKDDDAAPNKLIALVLLLLLGSGTECLQHLVYRTTLEFNDIFTNLLASLSTFGILALIDRSRKRRELIAYAMQDLDYIAPRERDAG